MFIYLKLLVKSYLWHYFGIKKAGMQNNLYIIQANSAKNYTAN